MKIYISADIEGVAGVLNWRETELNDPEFGRAAVRMTAEIASACEAAAGHGAEVLVKDAHDSARNIVPEGLPRGTRLLRGWTGEPESMMSGLDETYDGVFFIGYHTASGLNGNPLAHTMSHSKIYGMYLNGRLVSEFEWNAYIAAGLGVPCLLLSGDEEICRIAGGLLPGIETAAVKAGRGGGVLSLQPEDACQLIRQAAERALSGIGEKKERCLLSLPESFLLEIEFKEHYQATKAAHYPGARSLGPHKVAFESKHYRDILTARMFMMSV